VLTLSDAGVAFRSAAGSTIVSYRTFYRVGTTTVARPGVPAASLAYTGRIGNQTSYVFRFRDGVFETEAPGPLLHSLAEFILLEGEPGSGLRSELGGTADTAAMWEMIQRLAESPYADTLYALFGRPSAPIGLVGSTGARAGDLAEYVHARDSVALDPARMTTQAQLRHAFAHELGHRWESRARPEVDSVLNGWRGISDRERYGYLSGSEQRAEAIAFAVHFLQSTASGSVPGGEAVELLRHYEFLVPGTHQMARYLILQPSYRRHPLRAIISETT
jgi:hypothetical protein